MPGGCKAARIRSGSAALARRGGWAADCDPGAGGVLSWALVADGGDLARGAAPGRWAWRFSHSSCRGCGDFVMRALKCSSARHDRRVWRMTRAANCASRSEEVGDLDGAMHQNAPVCPSSVLFGTGDREQTATRCAHAHGIRKSGTRSGGCQVGRRDAGLISSSQAVMRPICTRRGRTERFAAGLDCDGAWSRTVGKRITTSPKGRAGQLARHFIGGIEVVLNAVSSMSRPGGRAPSDVAAVRARLVDTSGAAEAGGWCARGVLALGLDLEAVEKRHVVGVMLELAVVRHHLFDEARARRTYPGV